MNIHDIVRATRAAEKVLRETTALTPLQRIEFCVGFQAALFNAEFESAASPVCCGDSSPAAPSLVGAAGDFQVRACTPGAERVVRDLDRALACLPHGDSV